MCVASIVWVFCLSIMGGANCAVPTCPAKNSRHKGLSFHRIPRMGVSDPWRRQVLAKIDRVDRTFLEQSKQHHAKLWVCSRHYKPECFKTGPKGKRKLIEGSLPTENMPLKSVVTPQPPERPPPKNRDSAGPNVPEMDVPVPDVPAMNLTLNDLRRDLKRLPQPWTLLSNQKDTVSVAVIEDYVLKLCVHVDVNLSANVRVLGMPVPHLKQNMESVCLSQYLSSLSALKLCQGVTDPQLQQFSKPPQENAVSKHFLHTSLMCPETKPFVNSCVRSSSCSLLSEQDVCTHCQKTKTELTKKKERAEKAEKKPLHKFAPLHNASQKKLKLALLELRKRETIKKIQTQLEQDSVAVQPDIHSKLKDVLTVNEELIQDNLTKLFWEEQNKAFKAKGKSMKWHPMMLRLAIYIHSKSAAVYRSLRDTGVLKLPGESTLRDYSNYIHPEGGFNPEVVAEIKAAADKLKENERFVVLLHDEMSVKEDLVWDSKSGELVGFVNLNQWTWEMGTNTVASHVLVFFVVGVNSNLKYSMGYFGTRTATSDQMYPLFWQAIALLELTCKLKVIASTSDKASPNQRLYQLHGQAHQVCYKTLNFYAPTRHIYFFSDVPHLIKTIRNNLFRSSPHKTMLLWNNGKELLWAHIRRVYDEDRHMELVRRHKLTNEHVNLTSHSLMNVKLAAQVLSKSVGSILQGQGYEECHETAKLILFVNRFFDCLNSRSFEEAARKRVDDLKPYTNRNDPRFAFLANFLTFLNNWKENVNNRPGPFTKAQRARMFLSHQTFKGLEMTIRSFTEVAVYLLDNGVKFVLSNRFCQDPLEAHFGRHRGLGQRSDNPSIHTFGYQENKLRLQRGLAMRFQPKGNVEKRKREEIPVEISDSPLKKLKR